MSKKNGQEEIKRTMIASGIFMDKSREKKDGVSYYMINVELKLFMVLEITIDFSNSKNIRIDGSDSMEATAKVQPYEYKEVVRLILENGWSLKTKINFEISLPDIATQRKYLEPIEAEHKALIKKFGGLETLDVVNISEDKMNAFLLAKECEFVDNDFLPTYASVGFSENECIEKFDALIHWKRVKDIKYAEDMERNTNFPLQNFETPAHPTDVKSGKLDDFLALSAIAALSEIEGMAERTMELKSLTSLGLTKVKTFECGMERVLVLDDFIPCFPLGEPIFSSNYSRSFWVILLEKMLAKRYGSYAALREVSFLNAMIDLSGLPCFALPLQSARLASNRNEADKLWHDLRDWLDQKYLVAADIKRGPADHHAKDFNNQTSCVVLKAAENGDLRLVNIRNQFGIVDWHGDWSYESPLWTEDMVRHFLPDLSGEDETIWMSMEDFINIFERVNVVKVGKWNRRALKGLFVTAQDEDSPTVKQVAARNHYVLTVHEKSRVVIGIHQEDILTPGVKGSRPYIDAGVSILRKDGKSYKLVASAPPEIARQTFVEAILEAGSYIVLPTSTGLELKIPPVTRMTFKKYSMEDKALCSVILSVFHKLDLDSDGYISYPELKKFYARVGKSLTEDDFNVLLNVYAKRNLDTRLPHGLPERQFLSLFFDQFETFDQANQVFQSYGFNTNLFSCRSRLFGLTFHSEGFVDIHQEDALAANTDHSYNKLVLKLFGHNLTDIQKLHDPRNAGLEAVCFLNE